MDVKRIVKELGGPTVVAASLTSKRRQGSITPAAVSKWRQIPADRVMDLVAMSRGRLTPSALRPDVFGEPSLAVSTSSGADDAEQPASEASAPSLRGKEAHNDRRDLDRPKFGEAA